MQNLFEKTASLNEPIECFLFDAANEVFPVKPHWHYFAECIYMLHGSAEMTADSRTESVREGEFVIFPPSCVHGIHADSDVLPVFAGMKFDLGKFPSISSYSPSPARIFRAALENEMPLHFSAETAKEMDCASIFEDCIHEMRSFQYGYDVMLRSQIYRIIYRIIRLWSDCGLNISDCPLGADEDTTIENITEYIDRRLGEPLRVADIAAQCHLSYSAFAAKFRSLYGQSCKDYIERMRICKAEEYLLFTDLEISDISTATGFTDASHFIKSFRQHHGTTPGQFRRRRRRV